MEERPFSDISYEQFLREERLMGSRCKKCEALYVPPRPICIKCHGSEMEWVEMGGKGKLSAFTCIAIGPPFMIAEGYNRNNPYCSGVVELEEGVRVDARIEEVNPSFIEQLLAILTNPNIVFLLITIGVQAILIEISNPGGWVAGFIGAVCLALAGYGLGVLPVNWFGILFLVMAFVVCLWRQAGRLCFSARHSRRFRETLRLCVPIREARQRCSREYGPSLCSRGMRTCGLPIPREPSATFHNAGI